MSKLTKSQMREHRHNLSVQSHNDLTNEVFKLHKCLIENRFSNHEIDSKDVIGDAIKLIDYLSRKNYE